MFTVPQTDQDDYEKARRAQVKFLPDETPPDLPAKGKKGKGKKDGKKFRSRKVNGNGNS